MKVHNVRLGHANNSSSSHSIVFFPNAPEVPSGGGTDSFGWDDFTLSSAPSKAHYLHAILRYTLRSALGEETAVMVANELCGVRMEEDDGYGIDHESAWHYDEHGKQSPTTPEWRPSIHMPRWAARITLEVTAVRVEHLHAITEADAWAEGIGAVDGEIAAAAICRAAKVMACSPEDARATYGALWAEIYGAQSLVDNPWIWVGEFRRVV